MIAFQIQGIFLKRGGRGDIELPRLLAIILTCSIVLLSGCGVAPRVSTVEEIKAYCLGVSVNQAVQMQFQDYELDELASGLNAGDPVDELLNGFKNESLSAIDKYRQLKDEDNFVILANALTNFNNRCVELFG